MIMIYRTIRFPVVLYGFETWSLTFREKYRLKVFENRVLRIIFGPKRDDVTGKWTRLYKEEVHDLYSPPNDSDDKIKKNDRDRAHGIYGGEEGCIQSFGGGKKPEGMILFGRSRCRY